MYQKFTIRIPKNAFRILEEEAAKLGLSKAEFIRRWLENFAFDDQKIQPSSILEKESDDPPFHPLLVETVLLLRALIVQRDAQILRKVDIELDQLFGPNREKIYEN